ncbi:MAG: MG2 domain-containing protein, partial [Paludibacter sp.]
MKKILVVLSITTFLFTLLILAQKSDLTIENRWKNVQELADKQLPESALKEVEIILNQAQEEKNSVEIIKALVYKMRFILEKNPDEAPALIKDFEAFTEKSTDHAERALLHSMTADLYAQYFQNQSFKIIQRTELKGIIPDDIKEWTKNIFFDKINKHLTASLENKVLLQNTATLKYAALLEIGEDSPVLQPTLFDFLAYRRIEILQQISQTTNQKNPLLNAELFAEMPQFGYLKLDSTYNTSIENPIIESYQQLLLFRLNEKNVLAFLFADLQYLRFIKENTQILNADSLYLSALKSLKKQYFDNEAVVEVYAAIANYYLEKSNLNENISFKRIAYSICNEGIKRFPDYKRTSMLENLKQDITQQNISINYNQLVKPNTDLKIKINSSNITELKLSVYKLNTSAQNYYSYKQKNRNSKEFYPDTTLVETRLIKVEPDENFGNVETEIKIKTSDYGIYEFSLQKSDNNIPAQCTLGTFTVTDLAYINRTNKPETVDLYVLDRMSGKPQSKVNVSRFYSKWAGSGYEIIQANQRISNKYGFIQFPKLSNNYDNIYFFEKGNDKYLSSATNTYFFEQNYYENKNARISLFTDRSLYRPGQTVYFKAISYFLNSKKQEANVGAAYEVKLLDANRQEISKKKFKTNDFGSFAGEFILPEAGLNGRFQLQIGNFSQSFWVEEYKRPTFEVKIDKPKTEISFGEKVALIANVKAFAGYNIGDAKVKYRIVRRTHRYCWWWNQPDKEITNGTTNSKPDGTFEIVFIPEKTLNEITQFINDQYYTYTIYADVTDPKGETQQGEQTISVGDKSLFILAEIGQKIEKNQDVDIEISTETLNGEKLNSIVRYALYRLAESDVYAEKLDTKTSFKESEKVLSGSFETKNKKLNLVVNKLTSGRYKMIFTTTDAHGKEVNLEKVFILYGADDKRPPIKSYVWLLTPKTECEVGEKAVIHFGTSTKNSMILYEVMQGNNVLESRWISFS